jgi:putative membrane protein
MITIEIIACSIIGAVVSSVLACVPGLHVYNLLALLIVGIHVLGGHGLISSPEVFVPFAAGMIVGYSMLNTIPSVLLAAPDESALFTVLPGQKYLMRGRGYEGVMLTTAGGIAGLLLLVFVLGAIGPKVLPLAKVVFSPHTHWIIWCVISFMLMSEWPREGRLGQAGWIKFMEAWKPLSMGLLTFLLSGLLGFLLFYRSPLPPEIAFQNLMPAFVGLFTIPWLLMNIVSNVTPPAQTHATSSESFACATVLKGTVAGGLGGGFAAFFPAITGGVGALLAGAATAWRGDRVFLVSQGTSKLVYYVGGLLLLFVPGLHITRGAGAWMIKSMYLPQTWHDYYMALASIAIAGAISVLLVSPLAKASIAMITRFGYHQVSRISLVLIIGLVAGFTGMMGLFVMLVAMGIGLIPILYGTRRMNCLGIILLPIACNMSGIGPTVAGWLRLM